MTSLGEQEEIFLEGLRALGWTVERPAVIEEVYEPKVKDRVLVRLPGEDPAGVLGTVLEIESPDVVNVWYESSMGPRRLDMSPRYLVAADEFDEGGCPRTEHHRLDCSGAACRFAADPPAPASTELLAERFRIEVEYRLRTVAAYYRLRQKHGEAPNPKFLTDEIDSAVARLVKIVEDADLPKNALAASEDSTTSTVDSQGEPSIGDRVRIADAVEGDRFGEIVENDDPAVFGVLIPSGPYVLTVSRSRVTRPDVVGHDAVVGWGGAGSFGGRCSCGKWEADGLPDAIRSEATEHAGSYRNVSRIDS